MKTAISFRRRAGSRAAGAFLATALMLAALTAPASAYPAEDVGYLDYAEMVAAVHEIAASKPEIARLFSIGRSFEGRELWAAKVSDNAGIDEDEPEVLFDGGMHGREHMSTEMAVALFRNLVDGYGATPRITDMVNRTEITIIFNLNPDGSEYDPSSDTILSWRKNRQPTPGSAEIGTDINRNFGFQWGTNTLYSPPWRPRWARSAATPTPSRRTTRSTSATRWTGCTQPTEC